MESHLACLLLNLCFFDHPFSYIFKFLTKSLELFNFIILHLLSICNGGILTEKLYLIWVNSHQLLFQSLVNLSYFLALMFKVLNSLCIRFMAFYLIFRGFCQFITISSNIIDLLSNLWNVFFKRTYLGMDGLSHLCFKFEEPSLEHLWHFVFVTMLFLFNIQKGFVCSNLIVRSWLDKSFT